jgi:hypothetical protein
MTRKQPSEARKRQEELTTELRHIAEEIRPLTDSVDSLYILLQHVWQNREELFELLNDPSEHNDSRNELPPETLFCTCCDACATSLARALRAGWQCIVDDEGNDRGNYAGMCPACIDEEENAVSPVDELGAGHTSIMENPVEQGRLF